MNDMISRQAALDAIEVYFDGLPIAVHYDMIAMVHRLPSAQPTSPCALCIYSPPRPCTVCEECPAKGRET